jgi:serine/threonine protein kinase
VPVAAEYIRQAALGLQHAFEAGLVHRDIKPSNLLITRPEAGRRGDGRVTGTLSQGLVKILDMGLARMESVLETKASLTREGAMMGTPDYVAPEQARDASSADIRADLYSLGGTFYFLLTGRVPFPEGTMIEKLMKHQQEEPTPIEQFRPDVPAEIVAIIRKLMAKRPEDRFQTPIELVEALLPLLGGPSSGTFRAVTAVETPTPGEKTPLPPSIPTSWSQTPLPSSRTLASRPDTPHEVDVAQPAVTVVTAMSLQGVEPELDPDQIHDMIPPAHKVSQLRGHKGPVMGLAFSPDCKVLATGGVDATIHVWTLGATPRDLAVMQDSLLGDVQTLAIAPNGEYLVSGSASLDARLVKWSWREPRGRDHLALEGPGFSDGVAFTADGQILVSAVGSTIWMWDVGDGLPRKRTVLKNQTGDVKSLVFTRDGKQLASGDANGVVQLWKLGWLGIRPGTSLEGHRGSISSLAYSPDGQFLASASLDHTIRIWDGTGGVTKPKAILQGLKGIVRQMLFLPDPQMLLTACDGGQVILWRWADATRQHEWRLEQPIICSIALASDGSLLAAGSTDGTATIYDLVPEGE